MAIEFRTRSKAIQPNGNDVGACCTVDETNNTFVCEDNVKYVDCKRDLGIFRGKDSTCELQGCPGGDAIKPPAPLNSDLHGACKTCSSCTNNILEADCITQENFDAEFFEGRVCTEVEREKLSSIKDQKYACCIGDGSCFDTCNSDYCASLGGVFHDGIQTGTELQCASNPCGNLNNITETSACCRAGVCIGQMTEADCVTRNNGEWIINADCSIDYDCRTGTFIEERRREIPDQQQNRDSNGNFGGGQLVCSRPTPKKYYYDSNVGGEPTSGKWNGTPGPTYSKEPVWVTLVNTAGECPGGIISSTDGDISKATMWGGCQYPTSNGHYLCESKTSEECSQLEGKWWPGIYCDDIRSAPASGLLFDTVKPSGIGDRYLAGSCRLEDSVLSDGRNPDIECGDMKTQFQCFNALQRRYDYYLQVLEAQNNVNWTENDLSSRLKVTWRPGRKCSDPSCGNEVNLDSDITLGRCEISTTKDGTYVDGTGSDRSLTNYRYNTGRQTACLDNFTKPDCELIHGEWHSGCQTCDDVGLTRPTERGSCCTGVDECLDGKTYLECQGQQGFFHGPGTSCANRDCGKVAFLEPVTPEENLGTASCKCVVDEEPTETALRVFARQDGQNERDIWAGSTCGDPTVDAIPYYDETNFSKNIMVTYIDPPNIGGPFENEEIYADSRPIGDLKYNYSNEPFTTFIVSALEGGTGTFLDDIVIQDSQQLFFRVDKQEPFTIPFSSETLREIRGVTLETNQPRDTITRLILNYPSFHWTGGFGPPEGNRKIKYVNLTGMTQLRQLGLQGSSYEELQTDFEATIFPELTALDFRRSGLTEELSLIGCPKLERLALSDNEITTLNLSNNPNITSVDVTYNNLSSLTFADDSIYLADLRVGYNENLSSISGSYPQLETFYAQRCNFNTLDFRNMPFLLEVQLQRNSSLSSLNLSSCPSIDYINLDDCVTASTVLDSFVLPNQTNRTIRSLPDSISGAVIPDTNPALNRFSFRNNNVQATGYDDFVKKMADTIAITRFTNLNNTTFNAVGNFENRGDNPVYCETIDLSNVIDTVEGDTASVKKILEYIFGGITNVDRIQHTEKIRIILTGINSSVDYSSLSIIQQVLNRMSFII